jgi:hypothetical protein
MTKQKFDWDLLTKEDFDLAEEILGPRAGTNPDLVIAPDGVPYLYRWHHIRAAEANTYFHIQVASDPERPLHDHPWDNMSVILAGGYDEIFQLDPPHGAEHWRPLRVGSVIFRRAREAHRLILPKEFPYTMTLFSTGPKVREWGFWYPEGWRPFTDVTRVKDGMSIHVKP